MATRPFATDSPPYVNVAVVLSSAAAIESTPGGVSEPKRMAICAEPMMLSGGLSAVRDPGHGI